MSGHRFRFAPSPTGFLHIGGARTALYNWLLARNSARNALVLRLEDTDRERSTDEAIAQILEALEWLGLDWDEGPFRQTQRSPVYAERLEQLLGSGAAYWDTAGAEDVKRAKEGSGGRGYRGQPVEEGTPGAAVRLRVPDEGETVVHDVIRGESRFENALLDDFVIARADRTPLYNFAVAVDDSEMGITHVVRGDDHLSNTPRQLLVLTALGAAAPLYAHLPLLHGTDGKPLSKRHGAASVQELRDAGYLPEALRNHLALLGWGYDAETTFFTTDELVERFSLERVSRSPAVFDEQKLSWMNGHYIRELDPAELARRAADYMQREGISGADHPKLEQAAAAVRDKVSTLAEIPRLVGFAFGPVEMDQRAWDKVMAKEGARDALASAREALASVDPFDEQHTEAALRALAERLGVKPGALFQPLRVALTGRTVSAGIFESLALLGRDESLARIDAALARL
ncbi:MAG: glutamate--tRNA ligase [Solirubrobacterales bacterium]